MPPRYSVRDDHSLMTASTQRRLSQRNCRYRPMVEATLQTADRVSDDGHADANPADDDADCNGEVG